MDDFYMLSRYAPEDIDTDGKRREKFLRGLCDELKVPLSVAYTPNYQTLLVQAITLEDNMKKAENRKRKNTVSKHYTEPAYKKHTPYEGGSGYKHGNHHSGGNNHKHHVHTYGGGYKGGNGGYKSNGHHGHIGHQGNNRGNGSHHPNQDIKKDISQVVCYKCKSKGHYATECPEKKAEEAAKPNPFQKGHVNHVNVEEVYDEPDAVIGTFLLNSFPALVLFDTGAPHSFISREFVKNHKLVTSTMLNPVRVSSPGGEMFASTHCRDLTLEIGKNPFPVNLIILETQGLHVIIGMDWMTRFEGVIDCANRSITLTTPEKKKIRFKSKYELRKVRLNSLKGVSLRDVLIVREYPDVFPEELPGMPPNREVEFLIEL